MITRTTPAGANQSRISTGSGYEEARLRTGRRAEGQGVPTHSSVPSLNNWCFQIGTVALRSSISAREASNASARWAAVVATMTAASPIASRPTRCTAATPRTSYLTATPSATSWRRARAVGCAEYSSPVTPWPLSWSRTVPTNTSIPPTAGSASASSTSETSSAVSRRSSRRTTGAEAFTWSRVVEADQDLWGHAERVVWGHDQRPRTGTGRREQQPFQGHAVRADVQHLRQRVRHRRRGGRGHAGPVDDHEPDPVHDVAPRGFGELDARQRRGPPDRGSGAGPLPRRQGPRRRRGHAETRRPLAGLGHRVPLWGHQHCGVEPRRVGRGDGRRLAAAGRAGRGARGERDGERPSPGGPGDGGP